MEAVEPVVRAESTDVQQILVPLNFGQLESLNSSTDLAERNSPKRALQDYYYSTGLLRLCSALPPPFFIERVLASLWSLSDLKLKNREIPQGGQGHNLDVRTSWI